MSPPITVQAEVPSAVHAEGIVAVHEVDLRVQQPRRISWKSRAYTAEQKLEAFELQAVTAEHRAVTAEQKLEASELRAVTAEEELLTLKRKSTDQKNEKKLASVTAKLAKAAKSYATFKHNDSMYVE